MKLLLLAGMLSLSTVAAHAQSLDIGGVELHLGQKVDEALRSLSSYQARYTGSSWIFTQKVGNSYEALGSIGARDGALTFISKIFDTNGKGAPEAYTRASKEVRRRGGAACLTHEVEYTDGLVRAFETQCGLYKLSYLMPYQTADGTPTLSGVAILIRKP